jgi:arylsulfatase A-like enzyme
MKFFKYLLISSVLCFSIFAETKPNIIVIVADDMGWADVGYHGSKIKTPNIDSLCKQGIELDQHYVAPTCTPTRVSLLTGRYPSRFGNFKYSNERVLPWETETLASMLQKQGYETAISGKWHLGSKQSWGPRKFGFDQSYGSLAGGVGPYNHLYKGNTYHQTWHRNDKLIKEEGHVTDLLAKEAISFIQQKRSKPFFLYLPFTAVHDPFDEPQKYVDMVSADFDKGRQQYAASAVHMDEAIGKLVATLKESKQFDNTLILFFSDNGGTRGENGRNYPGKIAFSSKQGNNLPLRDGKLAVYEGGIRTPAFVLWPGKFTAGRKITSPLSVCDWLPTLASLTGYKSKDDLKLDGKNILPLLYKETSQEPRTFYFKNFDGRTYTRHGDWKIITHRNGTKELYNISKDPYEKSNVAGQYPEKVAALMKRLKVEQSKDNDALPDRKLD